MALYSGSCELCHETWENISFARKIGLLIWHRHLIDAILHSNAGFYLEEGGNNMVNMAADIGPLRFRDAALSFVLVVLIGGGIILISIGLIQSATGTVINGLTGLDTIVRGLHLLSYVGLFILVLFLWQGYRFGWGLAKKRLHRWLTFDDLFSSVK